MMLRYHVREVVTAALLLGLWILWQGDAATRQWVIGKKFRFIRFIPCIVIRTHTTLTNKCTLIIPCYVIQYSHSELAQHVSIPCWEHHQGLLDYNLHNYKLTIKVYIKSVRCIKVKIVGYLCWFLGPMCIVNCNLGKCSRSANRYEPGSPG
jgi:hypothetical protein